jgi:tetratricopeptide (TPR) repeat protein
MFKKRGVLKQRVKQLPATVQRCLIVALFLITTALPSLAHLVTENSFTQALPNPDLVEQGRALYEAERFHEAIRILQQAADTYSAKGDQLRQAMTLSNLSLAYQQLGLWTEAARAIAQSLNLLQNLDNSKERSAILAQALDIQGRIQLAQGQAESALKTWKQAESIYVQVGDQVALTRSRINQAQALQALGLYLQAQKTLVAVKQTLQNQPDSLLKATELRSLGNVLRVVGNLSESRQILEQSLKVAQALRSPQAVSDALLALGNTARAQQDTQAALAYYQQAAAASIPPEGIQAQLNQLSLLLETKQLNTVQALWPQIQTQIANLPPSRMAIYARINFAQSLIGLKQKTTTNTPSWLDIAQMLSIGVQEAKNLLDQRAESYVLGTLGKLYETTNQLSSAQNLTQKALLIAQTIDAPDIAYQWQWQLGRLLKA